MPYVNEPIVSPCPQADLTSRSSDTRTPRRWIYFPDLRPQQRRRLSSPSAEDRAVRFDLEPVVPDLTQARRFGCIHRQSYPRQHFPHAVHAGPQPWSPALVTRPRWTPENVNDHRQYVAEAVLQMPIFFLQQDGGLGLSLDDAINGRCQTLRDARELAQLGGRTTTHIRIGVCSHMPASYLCEKSTYDDAWCISVARV